MNLVDGSIFNLISNGILDGGFEIVYYKEILWFEIFCLIF